MPDENAPTVIVACGASSGPFATYGLSTKTEPAPYAKFSAGFADGFARVPQQLWEEYHTLCARKEAIEHLFEQAVPKRSA